MSQNGRPADDALVNLGLMLIAAVGALAALLRLAGTLAAWITGSPHPSRGLEAGLDLLARPADPATALEAPGL